MKKSVVISALLYYAGWLGAILGAAQGEPLLGSMTVMAILLIGLIQGGRPEVGFAGLALLLGLGFETLLLELQWVAYSCLLYTSPSPRDKRQSRMPSSA